MRAAFALPLICLALAAGPALADPPAWRGYAATPQHTSPAPAASQSFGRFHWTAKVDLDRQLTGDSLLIHYGSPMITAANTVIIPVKTGPDGDFRVDARSGATGALLWHRRTDYVPPPHIWGPSFPAHLTAQNRLYYATAGGTVKFRDDPDSTTGATGQIAFYGTGAYRADQAAYDANVMIDTPITADETGAIFFGFTVLGDTPAGLKSGVARIGPDGRGSWVRASDAAGDDVAITQVAMNCAPAVSNDGETVYIAVTDGRYGYLVGLDSATLTTKYKTRLLEPGSTASALIFDDSSASPTVGPDGDVYYGVLERDFTSHNDRGWLLHFNATLTRSKTPGSFGWDTTASVVPASAAPAYTGSSPYLLMVKYNNYYGIGTTGDGRNRLAILDPYARQNDPYSPNRVMKEVMTILGPTHQPGYPPQAVYEWCINSAVVDAVRHSVIANSEDGRLYRWDLASNSITESMTLNPPRPEAYTPTLIGPDGKVYAINNSVLYAIGD